MRGIWTMGELLVEVMRPRVDMSLREAGEFLGPYPSGAPGIFIDTVARLGKPAGIVGGVGKDDFGRCLLDRLRADGVDTSRVVEVEGISTGVAFVTYFGDGSRQFIYHIGNTPAAMAKAPDAASTPEAAYFHVMGCSLLASDAFRAEILRAMDGFAAKGAKVSFDPNIRVELLGARGLEGLVGPVMERCAVLQPGVEELLALAGKPTVEAAAEALFANPRLEVIALKRGRKGCSVFTRARRFDLGVYAVDPVDPTGAGDAFDAAFLCGLLDGKPLEETAKQATAAAALNTAAFGPMEGRISPETVAALMEHPLV